MKTFQIEDAKTRFFKSKEDYLSFRQAWKDYHNDGHVVELREYKDADGVHEYKLNTLDSRHYMLYNLLRGYEITYGYSPIVNSGRLEANKDYSGNSEPYAAMLGTAGSLFRVSVGFLRNLTNPADKDNWAYTNALKDWQELKKPFGDTITIEMIIELGELIEPWVRNPHEAEVEKELAVA